MTITIDDVLAMPVSGGIGSAQVKAEHHVMQAFGNVRSYSTTQTFHACPRKYAINKMRAAVGDTVRISSPTFAFGHAVGAGVAEYDRTGSLDAAMLAAFFAWDIDLLAGEHKPGKRAGKSFHEAIWALYMYERFVEEETDLRDYEVVGVESTIAIDFGDGHYYTGHIDELLRNKHTGSYRVKENKTTGLTFIDPALYSNSDQALGYSVVVDSLGGNEYEVMYTIYSASEQRWLSYSFIKSTLKKAEWLNDQLLINQQIDHYTELDFFPKRGGSCFDYMRRCEHYEACDVNMRDMFGSSIADLAKINDLQDLEAIEHIDFPTNLKQLVSSQQKGLSK